MTNQDSLFYGVSEAALRNWRRLNVESSGRLTTRANKRKSKKRFIPLEYMSNRENIFFVQEILDYIDSSNIDIISVMLSLGINIMKKERIYGRKNACSVLAEYSNIPVIDELDEIYIPDDEFDILGLIYQSWLLEGKKNITGSYYTPEITARTMLKNFDLSEGRTFLDPCCGSGAFMMSLNAENPEQIYGIDNDKTAVLIAKINLIRKYRDYDFVPNIFCRDFLTDKTEGRFDYIAANPPWGAVNVNSRETFSDFFIKSHSLLKDNGTIRFLFPESILNVKAHKDIRRFILETAGIVNITMHDDIFSGVSSRCVDIECRRNTDRAEFTLSERGIIRTINTKTIYASGNLVFNMLSDYEYSIIERVKSIGRYSLQNSIWALGIVTGDNKGKLFTESLDGMEKIYTGKEIMPYLLSPAKKYIFYDRNNLQQAAEDYIYRAPEKLVYKFISSKLVFAYDDTGSLFLNSANILIPDIPSMSIKTVMAFLNSPLFRFMYIRLFGEIKILKGNLIELTFPEISENDNYEISALVDEVLEGDGSKQKDIEDYIFALYNFNDEDIKYIRSIADGKAD